VNNSLFANSQEKPPRTIRLFEPDPRTTYAIEAAAQIAQVPRRLIAVYCKLRMVSPVANSARDAFYFNDEGIRVLRQIEYLRSFRGINLDGVKMILDLKIELEQLRTELRLLRR
jgi:DNA-binding transcriptional MerR regulator